MSVARRLLLVSVVALLACQDTPRNVEDAPPDGEAETATAMDEDTAAQRREAERPGFELAVDRLPEAGAYLSDGEGRTLYLFTADSAGVSQCYEECAEAWPPVVVQEGALSTEGDDLREDLVGTHERDDGELQVTYGGHPLYYYLEDREPGAVQGQDIHSYGGEWYLVSPDGEALEAEIESGNDTTQ